MLMKMLMDNVNGKINDGYQKMVIDYIEQMEMVLIMKMCGMELYFYDLEMN